MTGAQSGSVAIIRMSNHPYRIEKRLIPLTDVAAKTRHLPPEYIKGHADVSPAFIEYARPLVGELPQMAKLI
jgi:6-phosphofructokinase 1